MYCISRDIAFQNCSGQWLAVGLNLGVSLLHHCEIVEVNFKEFIVTSLDRKGVCNSEMIKTAWSLSTDLTLDSVSGMKALHACMYLESPTLVGWSVCKIAAMVNKELSHSIIASAATVDNHQLICLIVP